MQVGVWVDIGGAPIPCSLLSFLHACLLFAARTFKLVNKVFQMQLECLPPSLLVRAPPCSLPSDSWLTRFEAVSLFLCRRTTDGEGTAPIIEKWWQLSHRRPRKGRTR